MFGSSNSTTSRKTKLAKVLPPPSDAWQLELLEILKALEVRHHLRLGILFPFAVGEYFQAEIMTIFVQNDTIQ